MVDVVAIYMMTHIVSYCYLDPLDAIWLTVASRVDFRVKRSNDVYACVADSVISIGVPDTLDSDDCLAQMILHELCHSLVQGVDNLYVDDWGLDDTSGCKGDVREHACLRLQAHMTGTYGLRKVLAPTTTFRAYYDALPVDVMQHDADLSVPLARKGLKRSVCAPWFPHIDNGLAATAAIMGVVKDFGAKDPTRNHSALWTAFTGHKVVSGHTA